MSILKYFSRLSLTTKILILSFGLLILFLFLNIFLGLFLFEILGLSESELSSGQRQILPTLDLLSIITTIIFGVFGFHFLLTQLVSFPYNEHKLEIATTIFLVLFLLMFVPVTLANTQFDISTSIKLLLDVFYLLIGSIYLVLNTSMFYLDESRAITKRFARWSLLAFVIIFVYPLQSAFNTDFTIIVTFTLIYVLALLLVLLKEIQTLFSSNKNQGQHTKESKIEILSFIMLLALLIGFRIIGSYFAPIFA